MTDLSVEVRDQDIIVTKPGTGLSVTYHRAPGEATLVAMCAMRCDPDAPTLKFLTDAWKAAYTNSLAGVNGLWADSRSETALASDPA